MRSLVSLTYVTYVTQRHYRETQSLHVDAYSYLIRGSTIIRNRLGNQTVIPRSPNEIRKTYI